MNNSLFSVIIINNNNNNNNNNTLNTLITLFISHFLFSVKNVHGMELGKVGGDG